MANVLTIRVLAKDLLAPLVNAGVDLIQQLPNSSVSIIGTASDPDGTIASTLWTQISGPGVTLNTPNDLILQIDNLPVGVFVFQLTATDNDALVSSDQMTLTISAVNQLPTANAGADVNQTLPINSLQLAGSGTDPDGVIVSFAWAILTAPVGSVATFSPGSNVQNPIIENMNVAGTYTLQLTVTDNLGGTDTDTMDIVVNAITQNAPVINSIGNLLDVNESFMGALTGGTIIDTFSHILPWQFDVVVSELDNQDVTVVLELVIFGTSTVVATDTKIIIGGNGTAEMQINGPILVGPTNEPVAYTLNVVVTDTDLLTDSISRKVSLFDSSINTTPNGGLPTSLSPNTINGCYTGFNGTFVVPAGQTGSLSHILNAGSILDIIGLNLSNVGPGTYIFSILLENSNSPGVQTSVTINSTLSGGDVGSLLLKRTPQHSPNYDQTQC